MKSRIKKLNSLQPLKKVGFIIPAGNTTIEPMLNQILNQISDRISIHFARLALATDNAKAGGGFDVKPVLEAADLLSEAAVDMVVWFTPANGGSLSAAQIKNVCLSIKEQLDVPVSVSSLAVLDVLQHYRLNKVALLTCKQSGSNRDVTRLYSSAGHDVVQKTELDSGRPDAVAFDNVMQDVLDVDTAAADCVVVDDIELPATIMLDDIEHKLDKPVVDVMTAVVWQALRTLDINNPLHGWGQLLRNDDVVVELNAILKELLHSTSASRTTIRLDVPHLNIGVDDVYAEATDSGVSSLRLDSSLNQRSLATVLWMEKHKRMLIQDDCINTDVPPPSALIGVYGVKAQVLGPLLVNDYLQGWISIHYIPGTRAWAENEINALQHAMDRADDVLKRAGWFES